MTRTLLAPLALVALALAAGCSTVRQKPASIPGTSVSHSMPQDVSPSKPLYLLSVVLTNDYNAEFEPRLVSVVLFPDNGSQPNRIELGLDTAGTIRLASEGGKRKYLVRFVAEDPPYTLQALFADGGGAPFVVPLLLPIPVSAGGVYYLGSVKATVRKAKDGEFLAAGFSVDDSVGDSAGEAVAKDVARVIGRGLVIAPFAVADLALAAVTMGRLAIFPFTPIGVGAALGAIPSGTPRDAVPPYAQAGSTTGTFDVEITDDYVSDIEIFKDIFAWLSEVEVKKAVLPQWDRAKVQNCWKQNTDLLSWCPPAVQTTSASQAAGHVQVRSQNPDASRATADLPSQRASASRATAETDHAGPVRVPSRNPEASRATSDPPSQIASASRAPSEINQVACAKNSGRMEVREDGVVRDCGSGIEWTKSDSGRNFSMDQAARWCSEKGNGWRVPNPDELSRLFDSTGTMTTPCGSTACRVSPHFQLTDHEFWSSERHTANYAWVVDLESGRSTMVNQTTGKRVLCVRG